MNKTHRWTFVTSIELFISNGEYSPGNQATARIGKDGNTLYMSKPLTPATVRRILGLAGNRGLVCFWDAHDEGHGFSFLVQRGRDWSRNG